MSNPSQSDANWDNLSPEQQAMFNRIASKDGDPNMDGQDWFEHLVPSQLQENPEQVEVFMNGGTVTDEVWVYDQGTNSGHYETVTHEIPDKDVSRIQSGHNGGEYTPENTIMEDSSANRSRGAEDMSPEELESIEEANAFEAELIDQAETYNEVADTTTAAYTATTSAGEAADSFLDTVLDGVLPATYGAKAAHIMWDRTDHMPTQERVAVTALAGGGATLATYTALATVPGLNLVLGGIALYKLGTATHKMLTAS